MKNKKIPGGLVVVAVLLSGTTVLYLAGVERVGVTPANAVPPGEGGDPPYIGPPGGGSDCSEAGGFCAEAMGMGGGCRNVPCCPQGQTWCGSWDRQTVSFQEIGSPQPGSLGTCWKYDGSTAAYCNQIWCSHAPLCTAFCIQTPPSFDRLRSKPVQVAGSCLPKM